MATSRDGAAGGAGGFLDAIERIGNKVPHPAVIFLLLLVAVIVLSHVFYLLGTSVTYQTFDLETDLLVSNTMAVNSLLTADGIRFLVASGITYSIGFGGVGAVPAALIGIVVVGSVTALITLRGLQRSAPSWACTENALA